MGLSIHVVTDNYKDVYSKEFYENEKYRSKMYLSRDFAELMARLNVSFGESELKQVERITEVDLSPLWKMAIYHDEKVDVPEANIGTVLTTVVRLIEKLNDIENLQVQIDPYDDDIDIEYYFSDFLRQKSNGSEDNNFGQDLRNLVRLLEYALSKGATKVWFNIE
jgi:hypothetical protein